MDWIILWLDTQYKEHTEWFIFSDMKYSFQNGYWKVRINYQKTLLEGLELCINNHSECQSSK